MADEHVEKQFVDTETKPSFPNLIITGEGIVTKPTAVMPYAYTVKTKPLADFPPRVEIRKFGEGGDVISHFPHHLLSLCGIDTQPVFRMHEKDKIALNLEKLGFDTHTIMKLHDVHNRQLLALLCNLDFPDLVGYTPYATEYLAGNSKYAEGSRFIVSNVIMEMLTKAFTQDRTDLRILDVGGQQGQFASWLNEFLNQAGRLPATDVIDLIIDPRKNKGNSGEPYQPHPAVRFIQDDVTDLEETNKKLRVRGEKPAGPYDVVVMHDVLNIAFDKVKVMEQIWNQLAVGGKIIINFDAFDTVFNWNKLPFSPQQQSALEGVAIQMKYTNRAQSLSDNQWHNLHEQIKNAAQVNDSTQYQTLKDFLHSKGINYKMFGYTVGHRLEPDIADEHAPLMGIITKENDVNPFANSEIVGIGGVDYHMNNVPLVQLRRKIL